MTTTATPRPTPTRVRRREGHEHKALRAAVRARADWQRQKRELLEDGIAVRDHRRNDGGYRAEPVWVLPDLPMRIMSEVRDRRRRGDSWRTISRWLDVASPRRVPWTPDGVRVLLGEVRGIPPGIEGLVGELVAAQTAARVEAERLRVEAAKHFYVGLASRVPDEPGARWRELVNDWRDGESELDYRDRIRAELRTVRPDGIYRRVKLPRQLPGRGRWPEVPQEASLHKIHGYDRRPTLTKSQPFDDGAELPSSLEGTALGFDGDSDGKRGVDDQWADALEPATPECDDGVPSAGDVDSVDLLLYPAFTEEDNRRVHSLDPTGNRKAEGQGGVLLTHHGFTSTGQPKSTNKRGKSARFDDECRRRAAIHAGDIGMSLEALTAPYRPQPGKSDPLRSLRRAVAICLRLEGFSDAEIGLALDRHEDTIKPLTTGIAPMFPPGPTWKACEDNWTWKGREPEPDWTRTSLEVHLAVGRIESRGVVGANPPPWRFDGRRRTGRLRRAPVDAQRRFWDAEVLRRAVPWQPAYREVMGTKSLQISITPDLPVS